MRITMIGHSTVLIEAEGLKIVADPYFGTWGNPAYLRLEPPAMDRTELLDATLVLISHNHWDHVDGPYLRALSQDVPVLAPRGTAWVTRLRGAKRVVGMRPWQVRQFGEVAVTAVPAVHMALTVGYVIEAGGKRVYFSGDTYHRPFMKRIGGRFALDAALMPVTTYRVPMTMGERGAVKAARDLAPAVVVPIHLGIAPRTRLLRTSRSVDGFARRLKSAGLGAKVMPLGEGESWSL